MIAYPTTNVIGVIVLAFVSLSGWAGALLIAALAGNFILWGWEAWLSVQRHRARR